MRQRFSVKKFSKQTLELPDLVDKEVEEWVDRKMQNLAAKNGFSVEKDSVGIANFAEWIDFYRPMNMHSKPITNVLNPVQPQDVATKTYVDMKCDIYTTTANEITSQASYHKIGLNSDRTLHTALDESKTVINLPAGYFYRIQVVGVRTQGISATVRIALGNVTHRYLEVIRNQTFEFTSIFYLQEDGVMSLQAKKIATETVQIQAVLIIERI